jgi:beta-N-acetylhexosaminidase
VKSSRKKLRIANWRELISSTILFASRGDGILTFMHKIRLFLAVVIFLQPFIGFTASAAPPRDTAEQLLETMTPEERVGQLFIVTFKGQNIESDTPIYELITDYNISGVLLERSSDNFSPAPDTIADLAELISSLQILRFESSQLSALDAEGTGSVASPVYIPLLVGLNLNAGPEEERELLSGLSQIPAEMAIGATWDEQVAYELGSILGSELEALGFNLIIGPSLDVLEDPQITGVGDLGTRSFGGDPYWVGLLGEEFISGLHEASAGRISVFPKHFPGLGSSDRPIAEEVATVRKSLEQLKQIELAPFFTVTSGTPGSMLGIADGLLAAHIRYQGFQGNIRQTTRPVSLDQQAFNQLMSLEPLAAWHQAGGVVMSDSLGSRAIRRFRDPTEQTFQAHLVARDAFLAGNDLLLVKDFRDSNDSDEFTTIKDTLTFFANRYREDSLFAQRVNDSVLRILRMKLRLYGGTFNLTNVGEAENEVGSIGQSRAAVSEVAASAASLISPGADELADRVGGAPAFGERIVFFTDERSAMQCSTCPPSPILEANALERAVLRFYGPGAAGEVGGWNLRSFSTADLANYLGEIPPSTPGAPLASAEDVESAVISADWLIFVVLDSRDGRYGSDALKLLLDQRPDLARTKKLVVFAMDVPYILDATDISKVDAFYALYDSSGPFVDIAAKLLFLEATANSSSPVSIQGIGYELINATAPDPDQIIQLHIAMEDEAQAEEGFSVGDLITIETGVIMDTNGHRVPDRTPVDFHVSQQAEGIPPQVLSAVTQDGVASIQLALERTGLIEVSAQSGAARLSETLQLNVQLGVAAQATVISPTRMPTATSEPTRTPLAPTPTPGESASSNSSTSTPPSMGWADLVLGFLGVAIAGVGGFYITSSGGFRKQAQVRCVLVVVIAALGGYNYLALKLPGSELLIEAVGKFAGLILALIAGGLGLIVSRIWCQRSDT